MIPQLDSYDWEEAFAFAQHPTVPTFGCKPVHTGPVYREDVAELVGISEGENDSDPWLCVGRLIDGRWFSLSAWCDYTGWDCQAGGDCSVADTKENVLRYGTTEEARERMGLVL